MYESLKTRQIDIVLGVVPSATDIITEELIQERLVFAAHRKFGLIPDSVPDHHDLHNPYLVQPDQLNGLPFILSQTNNGLYSTYESVMQSNQIHPSRTISVNNLSTGLLLNVKGLGVQLISASALLLNRDPGVNQLDIFVLKNMPKTRKCVAAYQRNTVKKKLIQDLLHTIRTEVVPNCTP